MSIFEEAFNVVVGVEGGYQNIYNDRGNWTGGKPGVGINKGTKYGVTAMSYPHLDIRNLTLAQAKEIYKRDFWDKLNGDKLPAGLALAAFDTAINSGVGRALEFLNQTDQLSKFMALRRKFIRGLRLYSQKANSKKTWGQVWEERLDHIESVATQFDLRFPVISTPVASPQPPQGPANNYVLYNRGAGEVIISERFEDDKVIINPMANKVYVTLKN